MSNHKTTFIVEKNIAIPAPLTAPLGVYAELASKMQFGDSVVMSDIESKRLYQSIRKNGFKCVTRKIGDDKYRVWKLQD